MIKELIKKLVEKQDMTEEEATQGMFEIMNGETTHSQTAAFLTSLKMKGETSREILGMALAMREMSVKISAQHRPVIDTCGTGGDSKGNFSTFNVSTVSAIVVAGADITVAKHGNRAVSSACGSADLFEALGVKIDLVPEQAEKCLNETGIAFLFAPIFHPAMKNAAVPRKEMEIRTVFNILGPLCNPSNLSCQIIGVYDHSCAGKIASILPKLGITNAMVVSSRDGLDEISPSGDTFVAELKDNKVSFYEIKPQELGLEFTKLSEISGGDSKKNKEITLSVLKGEKSPYRNAVLLNAGAAIYIAEKARDIKEGIKIAEDVITSGNAMKKLELLIKFSNKV